MQFNVQQKDGITIIAMECEMFGGPGANLLADKLREFIENGEKWFILDMEKIPWMNSSGLGLLIKNMTIVNNAGGKIKLFYVSEKIQELLRMTRLNSIFEIFNEEKEAIESFK